MSEVQNIPLTAHSSMASRLFYRYQDDIPIPQGSLAFYKCPYRECIWTTTSILEVNDHVYAHWEAEEAKKKARKRMNRVRTEPSPEFTEQSGGRTKVSPEFSGVGGGRTQPSEDFTRDGGGLPVDRFVPPTAGAGMASQVRRPDPLTWSKHKLAEAERQEFTPIGQISQALLGDRDIDFGKCGPLLGLNPQKQLIVATPVDLLPSRRVWIDRRGKPIWNVEKMDERQRARALNGARLEERALKLEAYAESGRYKSFYVLQPLTQILFTTADPARHLIFVNFYPGQDGNYPVLLLDPQSRRLMIWGGGGYTFA